MPARQSEDIIVARFFSKQSAGITTQLYMLQSGEAAYLRNVQMCVDFSYVWMNGRRVHVPTELIRVRVCDSESEE